MSPPLPRKAATDDDELARLLRNLRYLQPFAQPWRLPKWSYERSYQIWAIAWRHRLPAPQRAPAVESTTTRLPAVHR